MGILSRFFGGSSARLEPTMASASQGTFPTSGGDERGKGEWRSLGPMPVAVSRLRPMVQTASFESSLTTRSRPTSLAPLVHDRSAQYLSGVVEGIAVAFPAPKPATPPDTPPPTTATPRVGVVQRFARRWNGLLGTGADEATAPNAVGDATSDPVPVMISPEPIDPGDEPGVPVPTDETEGIWPSPPVEIAGPATPSRPASEGHSLPLVVSQDNAPVAQRAPEAVSRPATQETATQETMHLHTAGAQDNAPAPPFRPAVAFGPAVATDLPVPVPVAGNPELSDASTLVPALVEPAPGNRGPNRRRRPGREQRPRPHFPSRNRRPIRSQQRRQSCRNGPCAPPTAPPPPSWAPFQAQRPHRTVPHP